MYNGFDLPKEELDKNLKFIREEISRVEKQIELLESMKGYHRQSDDARTLIHGFYRIKTELNSLLRHDYDVEN